MLLGRLSNFLQSSKDTISRTYYNNVKEKLLSQINLIGEETIAYIPQIEEECLNELFLNLPDANKESITNEAKSFLGNRVRHMTKEAVEESIISFRNELLANEYKIKCLVSNGDLDG